MTKLIIKGNSDYIGYLFRHLKKEHPSTKKRMKIMDFNNNRGYNK